MAQKTEPESGITAEMKIRLPPELRRQIEAAATESHRKMNAEIVARLERTFVEDLERNTKALKTIQASPSIQIEKRLIANKAELEQRIDDLADEVAALKTQLTALVGR